MPEAPLTTGPRAGSASLLMLFFSDSQVSGVYRPLATISFFPERELRAVHLFGP